MIKKLSKAIITSIICISLVGLLFINGVADVYKSTKYMNNINSKIQINKTVKKKIISMEFNTTWKGYKTWYLKSHIDDSTYYNPIPGKSITDNHKVRVVKTEYPDGYESKAGFFPKASIIVVYDAKTGGVLTSVGHYYGKQKKITSKE